MVLGGGGLLPSEDAPPAPPQASGAAFPEVALRVGKGGAPRTPTLTPEPPLGAQAALASGHSPGPSGPACGVLSAAPALHASGMSSDISGTWGPSPRSILAWSGINASVSVPPPQGAGAPKPQLPPLCGPVQPFACDHTAGVWDAFPGSGCGDRAPLMMGRPRVQTACL